MCGCKIRRGRERRNLRWAKCEGTDFLVPSAKFVLCGRHVGLTARGIALRRPIAPTDPHMKVNILEWNAVSTWHWHLSDDAGYVDELCGICRVSFDGTCPECKYPGDECPLVLGGGCPHNFHHHCIIKWLEQEASKGLCPMCRQVFLPKDDAGQELQALIDGHKAVRERGTEEFDDFERLS